MARKIYGFTSVAKGIARALISPAEISPVFDPTSSQKPIPPKKYNAIWDTGASNTCISPKVVMECELKPTSITKVHTAGGEKTTPIYLVDLLLPNNVLIKNLRVARGEIVGGSDILIGMDVITRGDLVITNKEKTMFSFRIPSVESIDFAPRKPASSPQKTPRNAPCPCGSGKKYKKCCGK